MITAPKKLNPSLIFKVKALLKHFTLHQQDSKPIDLPANNRLGRKGLSEKNTQT